MHRPKLALLLGFEVFERDLDEREIEIVHGYLPIAREHSDVIVLSGIEHHTLGMQSLQHFLCQLRAVVMVLSIAIFKAPPDDTAFSPFAVNMPSCSIAATTRRAGGVKGPNGRPMYGSLGSLKVSVSS